LENEGVRTVLVKEKSVWFASVNGNIYEYSDDKVKFVTGIPNVNTEGKNIKNIVISKGNIMFISTDYGKIYKYDLTNKAFTDLAGTFNDYPGSIVLRMDNNDMLWIGTETFGLFVYDITNQKFIQDSLFENEANAIKREMFINLFLDSKGYIYGCTDGGGLYKVNSLTGEVKLFTKNTSNPYSLSSNTILSVNEDKQHNIWICTNYGYINVLPSNNSEIEYFSGTDGDNPARVLSVYKGIDNTLWIGTDGLGLNKMTFNNGELISCNQYLYNKETDKGFYVQSIVEDGNHNIWLGTYNNGLWIYNKGKDKFKKKPVLNSKGIEATDVRTVFKDSKGRIWVGSNVSISLYSDGLYLMASFDIESNGLEGSNIESILEDNNGVLWLGLYEGGLFKFNENETNIQNSNFTNYSRTTDYHDDRIYSVRSMTLVKPNEIWLLNNIGELLSFNVNTNTFNTIEAFPNVTEKRYGSIIAQDSLNVWLSSINGIDHLDIKNKKAVTYHSSDGLSDDSFMFRSVFKDHKGILYFGSTKGLNSFNPKRINKKPSEAKLQINFIEILNQPAESIIPDQISQGIFNTEYLSLKYNMSSFSFKFSAMGDLINPKYYYAYRLKGFDQDWIYGHTERTATYTNIPPGNYTFEVKAGIEKNIWNIGSKQVEIRIMQPFWNTPLAYVIYLMVLGIMLLGILKWYYLRKQLLINRISSYKEKELHKLKMNFFAKMSHEIQTPITLILGPIDDMINKADLNGNLLLKERLSIIANNAFRLSRIAKELTIVRNNELNKLTLSVNQNNLCNDIETICLSFRDLARAKHIDFIINCPGNISPSWYDRDKLEHILYNLLSNAFKFTPREGNIQLSLIPLKQNKFVKISVSDSGPGIEKGELENIFKLFYRSNSISKAEGTGIGLALTKELVSLHKGKIKVSSKENKGSTFTFKIPIAEEFYDYHEKITSSKAEEVKVDQIENNEPINDLNHNQEKQTILIVEDNFELQNFLNGLLNKQYNILLAENGKEGFYYAKNNIPDLILSDIMMPEMDGIEMCEALNSYNLTKHIPVILLTAKNSTNAKISGLKSGAIEYINKPFNTNELLLKINNILNSKTKIISKYRKELINTPTINKSKTQDEIFLENLVKAVNEKMENPNFKVDELSEMLNLSHSSLYRKCFSITGLSVRDFITYHRLNKAAILLVKFGYPISDTAYETGFRDPKYFSKCFKKHFEVTPKVFKTRTKNIEDLESYLNNFKINISKAS
jgi:signal transduction histidine kinase/DNA-binding response OmpR family regulator/ligand-binding sensor domain-containing protein